MFKVSLDYIARPCLKTTTQKKKPKSKPETGEVAQLSVSRVFASQALGPEFRSLSPMYKATIPCTSNLFGGEMGEGGRQTPANSLAADLACLVKFQVAERPCLG